VSQRQYTSELSHIPANSNTGFLFWSALRHFAEKIEMSEKKTSKSAQCPKVL
jgi:hypothetical protein